MRNRDSGVGPVVTSGEWGRIAEESNREYLGRVGISWDMNLRE